MYEWLEDIGAILLDMMGTYYGTRTVVMNKALEEIVVSAAGKPTINREDGRMETRATTKRVAVTYDFSKFKNLWFNTRVNAGATTYYSEIAMVQTLDNLRRDGTLEVIDYLERLPDKLIPRKAELVESLRRKTGTPALPAGEMKGGYAVGGSLSPERARENLPTAMRIRYDDLPAAAKRGLDRLAESR